MNAAAKMIHQANLFNGQYFELRISKMTFIQCLLWLSVLVSAVTVVYTTNMYRITFNQLQAAEQKMHDLELRHGQLLLERTSLATPSRVRRIATQQLNMVMPADKQIRLIRVQ